MTKKWFSCVLVAALLANTAMPTITFGEVSDNPETAAEVTTETETEQTAESMAITAEVIGTNDERVSEKYLKRYRVGVNEDEDGYISSYSSNISYYGNSVLANAFDGNWSTHWEGNANRAGDYIDVTFSKTTQIDRIIYATRQDGGAPKGYPQKLTIKSYDEATDSWITVAEGESTVTKNYVLFTLPKAISFDKLRFQYTQPYNNYPSAVEIAFLRPEDIVISGDVQISGTAEIGKTLTANTYIDNVQSYKYQWQYSDDGTSFTDISGANEKQYTITENKKYYRVVVGDSTGEYLGRIESDAYGGSIAVAIDGTAKIGACLGVDTKYISNDEKLSYKWQYSTDNVSFTDIELTSEEENTGNYYVPVEMSNQYIRVGVSTDGTRYSYSDSVLIPADAWMTGAPQVGSTIKASINGYTQGISYVWQRADTSDGAYTDVATTPTYTLTSEDEGKYIRVKIVVDTTGSELYSDTWQISAEGSYTEYNDDAIYLSDLSDNDLISSSIGYSTYKKDTNINGGTITLLQNGQRKYFVKGIGAHAPSTLVYNIAYYVEKYQYTRFKGYLGIDADAGADGNAKIFIYTSSDNSTWKMVANTGVVKPDTDAVYVDIDLTGVRYLKIVTDANGVNSCDHTVIGNAMLTKTEHKESSQTVDFIKTVAEYDKELKAYGTSPDLIKNDEYKKLLYQREFVNSFGYDLLQSYVSYDANIKNAVQWLFDDVENLEYYIMGGAPTGTYVKSMQVLGRLLEAHGDDVNDSTYGDLYKRMIITLSLTHSKTVRFWIGDMTPKGGSTTSGENSKNISDPVKRYEVYKKMLLANKLHPMFNNLEVEEMRLVMNTKLDDNEIEWLHDYVVSRNGGTWGYSDWWIPYKNQSWPWHDDKFYDPETIGDYSSQYGNFLDYGVKVEKYNPSLWMVYAYTGICWHISNAGSNAYAAYGIPTMTLGQPSHVCYIHSYPDANGNVTWGTSYFVGGWHDARFETYTGDAGYYNQRPLNNWGLGSYTNYSTTASYMWLSQAAIDNYASYVKSQSLVRMANIYSGNDDVQRNLYKEAIEINNYNFDAYLALINSYNGDQTVSDEERYSLASQILKNLSENPMPANDLWQLLNSQISDEKISVQMNVIRSVELNGWLTSSNSNIKAVAGLIAGTAASNKVATFSFDGENANKLMLSEQYANLGVYWDYSLDGENWIEADGDVVELTADELAMINTDDDIRVHIMGMDYTDENIYTIDITKADTPNLYRNDLENRLIGTSSTMEWTEDGETWCAFTDGLRFSGDRTITARVGATGTVMESEPLTYVFTEDNNTAQKSYVYLERVALKAYSTQHDNENAAANATDGNINTIWHSSYANGSNTDLERYLVYEFDKPLYLTEVDYTPRQSGTNGNFLSCEVYVSMDGEAWTLAGSASGWQNNASKKTLSLTAPVYAKYVKVVGTKTSGNFGSASMIEFYESTAIGDQEPVGLELASKPDKMEYIVGDDFISDGMIVNAVYEDGSKSMVYPTELTVETRDFNEVGEKTVTVTYKELKTEFTVMVYNVDEVEAYIDDTPYRTFAVALAMAKNGDVIELQRDVTMTTSYALTKSVTITSKDGSIFTISRGSELKNDYMFSNTSGTLTLKNVVIDGGAVWADGSNSGLSSTRALLSLTNGAGLVLDEGAVLQNNDNTAVWPYAGGAVYASTGTINITGGSILNNKCSSFGGAIYAGNNNPSKVTMVSGLVSGNVSNGSGGAFCVDHKSTFTMSGGVIENNVATNANGGAVWMSNGASVISGGTIRNNTANKGNALYLNDSGILTLKGEADIDDVVYTNGKNITIDGDLGTHKINVIKSDNLTNGTVIASVTTGTDAYKAAEVLSVNGYYSYADDTNVYITADDLTGDVDMNGVVDKKDVAVLLKYLSGIEIKSGFGIERADVNLDGAVNALDAVELAKRIS